MQVFREYEKRLCIIDHEGCVNLLDKDNTSGANSVLCYGYVDHTAGLTFEVLALAYRIHDDYTIVKDIDDMGMKIRAEESMLIDAMPIRNRALMAKYEKRIKVLDIYYENKEVINARDCGEIDRYRHRLFPDDIRVALITNETECEWVWVRCENVRYINGLNIRTYEGTLLNEPQNNCNYHLGSKVKFVVNNRGNESYCLGGMF